MKSDNQNKVGTSRFTNFERIERVPPLKMILFCSMAGIGVLFTILAYMFLVNLALAPENEVLTIPKFFSVSTVLVLFGSFFMQQAPTFYRQDDLASLKKYLLGALVLAAGFTITQVLAWEELLLMEVPFLKENSAGTLLFLISALHVLHLAGGLAFACFLFLKTSKAAADPVRTLIFIRDPFRNLQLEMLKTYWHFLAGLWVAEYFLFLFAL